LLCKRIFCRARLLPCLLVMAWNVLACAGAFAAEERYDYDALGRLIRVIDEQGRVTEYVYDASGNITQVTGTGPGSAQAPVVISIAPTSVPRNRAKTLQVTGTGFQGARVLASDPALDISNVSISPTGITFTLTVSPTAGLGNQTITVANAVGSAQATIGVLPAPTYIVTPNPLVLPPDNVARRFVIEASEAEGISITASSLNPSIAQVAAAAITFAPGQTQATGTITGIAAGTTLISLASPAFVEPVVATIYVTTDAASANVAHSRVLGILKGDIASPPPGGKFEPILTPILGVEKQ
jgi:YD repeat-containing protein